MFGKRSNVPYGIKEWVCDTENDLKDIPKDKVGCSVYIIEESKYYILNDAKEWQEAEINDCI